MALTDQQLLLLDNFMYLKASVNTETEYETLGDMVRDYKEHPEKYQGAGWDDDTIAKYEYIIEEIAADEQLCALGLGEVTDPEKDDLVRGRCFIEYGENKEVTGHVVAFRGTGDADNAWIDNFEGAYELETEAQGIAKDFIEELGYNDITITGHSKGGNMAMYATIMCGDQIDRCVSYDGQGFGRIFLSSIPEAQLAEASEKITSIYAHNDYVNILLTPVAGESYCVPNAYDGFVGRHSAYPLYLSNEQALDENGGMFTEEMTVNRDLSMTAAHYALEHLLLTLPEEEREAFADLAGNVVAQFVGEETSWKDTGSNLLDEAKEYLGQRLDGLGEVADYVGDKVSGAADSIVDFGGDLVDSAQEIGGGIAGLGIGLWESAKDVGGGIGDLGGGLVDGLGEIFNGNLMDGLGEIGGGIADLGIGLWEGVQDLGDGLLDLGEGLVDGAIEAGEGLLDLGGDFIDGALEVGGDILDGAIEFGNTTLDVIENGAEGAMEFLGDAKDELFDFLGIGEKTVTKGAISFNRDALENVDLARSLRRGGTIEATSSTGGRPRAINDGSANFAGAGKHREASSRER